MSSLAGRNVMHKSKIAGARLVLTLIIGLTRYGLCQTAPSLGVTPIGVGAYPLTFTTASTWFAHKADDKEKLVTVMFYFQGAAGWLTKGTDFKWQVAQSPASIDMMVGTFPIRARYWPNTDEVEVQGHRFPRGHDNVFLVSATDSASPTVTPLGIHNLDFSPNDMPAVVLLRRDPGVWAAVSGHPAKDHPLGQPVTASADVQAWDKEGLKLLLSGSKEGQTQGCDLFRRAAERGYAPSQYRLGYCFQSGEGAKQDFAVANHWYEMAGNQGYDDAEYKLGYSFRTGRGTPIDLPKALSWYKKAVQSGDSDAMQNLGWMYAKGQGTAADQAEAYRWFVKAAQHGDMGAQLEAARCLNDGEGTTKDPTLSYSWVLVLEAQKEQFAPDDWKQVQTLISNLTSQLSGEAIDRADKQSKVWMAQISDAEMVADAKQ
jgi:TPR repeat protein